MKFQDYVYTRIEMDDLRTKVQDFTKQLEQADNYEQFYKIYTATNDLFDHVETMMALNEIRYTINTKDEFLSDETDYWDNHDPIYDDIRTTFLKVVFASPFVDELRKNVPETFFLSNENQLRAFSEEIIEELKEENRLTTEYDELIADAEIEFDGKTLSLEALMAYAENPDEEIRKKALQAYWGYFAEHEATLDEIFDNLVKVRDTIAKKLGFNNFVELGYIRMDRFGYHEKEVAEHRRQILEEVVPIVQNLFKAQEKRLELDRLEIHNESYLFKTGNPMPKGNASKMVQIASAMYHEMAPEIGEFFDFMVSNNLMDLESKLGKAGGGYADYMYDYEAPFIFANFNGTSADVDVLTHEVGHAFQFYSARWIRPTDCIGASSDASEIHSMAMEYLAWPWMDRFFGKDTEKYYYYHLANNLKYLPYMALVDHFQHEIYRNVNLTPEERKDLWRRLEKEYLPHKDYESISFLDKGTWWFRQSHIFCDPFYYIDYSLASVVAMQFWLRMQKTKKDGKKAVDKGIMNDYLAVCKIGGSKIFGDIVKTANLTSPFEEGCLTDIMKQVEAYFAGVDDIALDKE